MRAKNDGAEQLPEKTEATAATDSKPNKRPSWREARERTLIGIPDSMLLFVTGVKKKLVKAPNGEEVLYDQEVSIPVKLTSSPVAGYFAGGGCAFAITERWCEKRGVKFEETIQQILKSEGYGLRFVFEDDDSTDERGEPMVKRVLDQLRGRHDKEREVQAEAHEHVVMHSDSML